MQQDLPHKKKEDDRRTSHGHLQVPDGRRNGRLHGIQPFGTGTSPSRNSELDQTVQRSSNEGEETEETQTAAFRPVRRGQTVDHRVC